MVEQKRGLQAGGATNARAPTVALAGNLEDNEKRLSHIAELASVLGLVGLLAALLMFAPFHPNVLGGFVIHVPKELLSVLPTDVKTIEYAPSTVTEPYGGLAFGLFLFVIAWGTILRGRQILGWSILVMSVLPWSIVGIDIPGLGMSGLIIIGHKCLKAFRTRDMKAAVLLSPFLALSLGIVPFPAAQSQQKAVGIPYHMHQPQQPKSSNFSLASLTVPPGLELEKRYVVAQELFLAGKDEDLIRVLAGLPNAAFEQDTLMSRRLLEMRLEVERAGKLQALEGRSSLLARLDPRIAARFLAILSIAVIAIAEFAAFFSDRLYRRASRVDRLSRRLASSEQPVAIVDPLERLQGYARNIRRRFHRALTGSAILSLLAVVLFALSFIGLETSANTSFSNVHLLPVIAEHLETQAGLVVDRPDVDPYADALFIVKFIAALMVPLCAYLAYRGNWPAFRLGLLGLAVLFLSVITTSLIGVLIAIVFARNRKLLYRTFAITLFVAEIVLGGVSYYAFLHAGAVELPPTTRLESLVSQTAQAIPDAAGKGAALANGFRYTQAQIAYLKGDEEGVATSLEGLSQDGLGLTDIAYQRIAVMRLWGISRDIDPARFGDASAYSAIYALSARLSALLEWAVLPLAFAAIAGGLMAWLYLRRASRMEHMMQEIARVSVRKRSMALS